MQMKHNSYAKQHKTNSEETAAVSSNIKQPAVAGNIRQTAKKLQLF
jgi:hypothetical protein